MSLGRGRESAAAVSCGRIWGCADCGMQVQCDDTAGLSNGRSRGSCGRNRRGWSNDLRTATDAVRTGSRVGTSALFGDRELRCGRDHGALSDVQIADRTSRCGLDTRRRRDDGRLRSLIAALRSAQVGGGATTEFCGVSAFRRSEIGRIGRRHHGVLYLRRDSRNLGGRGQGNGRNCEPRLLPLVGPRHNIGQGHIALQFDVGRRHDGLRSIVGFRRKGNDRLAREFWIWFLGLLRLCRARVERRQIFRSLVIDHLRSGRRQASPRLAVGAQRSESIRSAARTPRRDRRPTGEIEPREAGASRTHQARTALERNAVRAEEGGAERLDRGGCRRRREAMKAARPEAAERARVAAISSRGRAAVILPIVDAGQRSWDSREDIRFQ